MDNGSTLDPKFARFLRKACVKLAWNNVLRYIEMISEICETACAI